MRTTYHLAFSLLVASAVLNTPARLRAAPETATARFSGGVWRLQRTTTLQKLTIPAGGRIVAPPGKSLTMTVNAISTAIVPGTYRGRIVLTLTDDIPISAMGGNYHYRAAIYVDGTPVPAKSVAAAVRGGPIALTSASNILITSNEENFNGVVVTGAANYTLNHVTINFTGNGGNDFAGYGAAIMSSGKARLTINGAKISTRGAVRTALWIGGDSTMIVNDADIEVFSGHLPKGYQFSIMPGKMMEVPYGLGLYGNVRATNLIDQAAVYYNRVHVRAHGWGALSSDGSGPTHMYVKDSHVETIGSGYGAYANGEAHDHFDHVRFDVADYGLIVGGPGSGTFTNGTVVNSGKIGVMWHQGTGGGTVTVDKGSELNSRETMFEVKGRGANILVDGAKLNPGNGIILQTMPNDDPIMLAMARGAGAGGPPPGPPPSAPGESQPGGGFAPGAMPGAGAPAYSGNVVADFKNLTMSGDIVHAMADVGELRVTLDNASLTGAISSATASPASGRVATADTRREIGVVTNTFGPTRGKHGLQVALAGASHWTVTKTSYLDQLTIAPGATVSAPPGRTVALLIDGKEAAPVPGAYRGQIVLQLR